MTIVCIEVGLLSHSHAAGSSSHCIREAFFIPKKLTLCLNLHWKSVQAHQLKTCLCVMKKTLYVFTALLQNHITAQAGKDFRRYLVQLSWERQPSHLFTRCRLFTSICRLIYYLLFSSLMLDVSQHMLVQSWVMLAIIQRIDNSRLETCRNKMEIAACHRELIYVFAN